MVKEGMWVNHVPTMVGGQGSRLVTYFYQHHFIFTNPSMDLSVTDRTIGDPKPVSKLEGFDSHLNIIDEYVISLKHDTFCDWLLPGSYFSRLLITDTHIYTFLTIFSSNYKIYIQVLHQQIRI